jgi:DNA modification methylase
MQIKSKEISEVATSVLQHHPKNMHVHSDEQIERLCELIKYQGWRNPIIVQKGTNLVVAGNGRLMAAKKLGIEKVPVIEQEFDSEAQLYAYMVSDNAIGKDTWATLDLAQINLDILDLGPDLDISMLGLKDFVIEPAEKFEPQADEDEVPSVDHPITRRGDIWLLGNHRVMCGDSTMIDDVEKLMNGEKADMVFTDPPYGINEETDRAFASRTRKAKGNTFSKIIGDDSIQTALDILPLIEEVPIHVLWGANYYCHSLPQSNNWLVWDKREEEKERDMNSDCELAYVKHGKSSVRIFRHKWKGMIKASEHGQARVHPTQKPIALAEWCFNEYNKDGKSVLDLFLGSGSTLIACEKTNRKCYGMELDSKYCDTIIKRFEQYSCKKATLELTGQTYEELKAERDLTQHQKQN